MVRRVSLHSLYLVRVRVWVTFAFPCMTECVRWQTFYEGMRAGFTASAGYGVDGASGEGRPVEGGDVARGLTMVAPALRRAAAVTEARCGEETRRRRQRIAADWEAWAGDFPSSIRPRLLSCRPMDVLVFLEEWRFTHRGRRRAGEAGTSAAGEEFPVSPSTLRQTSSMLHGVFEGLGR